MVATKVELLGFLVGKAGTNAIYTANTANKTRKQKVGLSQVKE